MSAKITGDFLAMCIRIICCVVLIVLIWRNNWMAVKVTLTLALITDIGGAVLGHIAARKREARIAYAKRFM